MLIAVVPSDNRCRAVVISLLMFLSLHYCSLLDSPVNKLLRNYSCLCLFVGQSGHGSYCGYHLLLVGLLKADVVIQIGRLVEERCSGDL